jgi:cell volume regulation protein A
VEHLNQAIFLGAALVLASIFAGTLSSRFGAPLLFVFLGLGMLAGEEGPGGIPFHDFKTAYLIGSAALAIILFDGGLRTRRDTFLLAARPALALATLGVVVTAGLVGAVAHYALGLGKLQAFLIGAIVASTDAAAVFFLLNVRGMEIQRRVRATLEVESGINDPMAVFLTIAAVELLRHGQAMTTEQLALTFVIQMAGGGIIGAAGGFGLVALINRLELASGLYPIVAVASALALFGGAQSIGASGFLAVYLAGMIVGNRRHRAAQLINRFHDGLAWLSQIVMFLMLGLLVTPSRLLPDLLPALVVAAALVLLARPAAVVLCLAPFRFTLPETLFVSWVGLRGAVPIFLATVPVLAPLPRGEHYFAVAFVVVLTSLVIQGWTIAPAARLLGLELPPATEGSERLELETVSGIDRDIAGYRVAPGSPALAHAYGELPLPRRARIISVIREGTVMDRTKLARLEADDYVLAVAPPEQMIHLDRLFATRPAPRRVRREVFGEFILDGRATLGAVADLYNLPVAPEDRALPLGTFIARRLKRRIVAGDRLRLGGVELVAREVDLGKVTSVGVELEPEEHWLLRLRPVAALRRLLRRG